MENGPISKHQPGLDAQADVLDAWRKGQSDLWAQLEPLVDAAIKNRLVAFASAPPTGFVSPVDGYEQIEPLVNASITRRLIAFHAAIVRGGEIPELRPAKVDCSEDILKEEALKRLAEVWYAMGMKQCP